MRLFLLSLALTACAAAPLDQRAPSAVLEGMGGGHGGGGNLIPVYPASENELAEAVRALPNLLWKVFNYHELLVDPNEYTRSFWALSLDDQPSAGPGQRLHVDRKVLAAVHAKLFPRRGPDVFAELERVHFRLLRHGVCNDLRFQHRDASAFNADPQEICFSAERLTQKITTDTMGTEMLALGAHEMAHRMGANEEEAQALQLAVVITLDHADLAHLQAQMGGDDGYWDDDHTLEDIERWMRDFNPKDPMSLAALCISLGSLRDIPMRRMEDMRLELKHGFAKMRVRGMRALVAADYQAMAAGGFCVPGGNGGRDEMKAQQVGSLEEQGEYSITIGAKGYYTMPGHALNLEELKFNYAQFQQSYNLYKLNFRK